MVKDQLLKNFPDQKIIQHILDCFGLENLEDTRFFTKQHMQEIDTVQKINDLIEEFYNTDAINSALGGLMLKKELKYMKLTKIDTRRKKNVCS